MSKMNLQQLQSKTHQELVEIKASFEKRQKELEKLKAKNGKDWTMEAQDELNEVTLFLVDVEELIEEKANEEGAKENNEEAKDASEYTPKKGTEKLVHAKISKGRRFDPTSGKELTKPYVQMFTYGEWKLFQQNHASIGFVILEVLHNPYDQVK